MRDVPLLAAGCPNALADLQILGLLPPFRPHSPPGTELEGVHNLVSAVIFALPDSQKSQELAAKHIALVANDTTAAKETLKYRM